jgi:erythromycin esterase
VNRVVILGITLACAVAGNAATQPARAERHMPGPAAAFVQWARDHAVPLPDCDVEAETPDFGSIAGRSGEADMVALGEPAHRAHEPLAVRNCLFRYLVERQGFTAIAIESGTAEARRLNDYVAGGEGDGSQLVRTGLSWGFWRFSENLELIEWMRRYNRDPAHTRKIAFYGMDMSGGDANGWGNARITLDAVTAYLHRFDPSASGPVRDAVSGIAGRFTETGYRALGPADQRRQRAIIGQLERYLDGHRARLIASSGGKEFAWARRNAALARQLQHMFQVSQPPGEDLSPDDWKADAVRDAAMAENARWALDREGPDGRVLVFAHNGHVMNAATRGGIWSVYRRAPTAMGQHLRAALGRKLTIVAMASGRNGPGLPPVAGDKGRLNAALADAGTGNYLVDLRKSTNSWLRSRQTIRANHSTETEIVPKTSMDAVIFIETLTAAHKAP